MDLRSEFVALAQVEGANVALLCGRYGVSRKTGYKWIRRFKVNLCPGQAIFNASCGRMWLYVSR